MLRRAFVAAAVLFWTRGVVAACTEVKHGPNPPFKAKRTGGRYECRVVGYYTDTHDLTAAGVESWEWASTRSDKRMSELLGLRTAFLDWFKRQYGELGGTNAEAIEQVQFIVDAWKQNKVCVVTDTGWELRDRP